MSSLSFGIKVTDGSNFGTFGVRVGGRGLVDGEHSVHEEAVFAKEVLGGEGCGGKGFGGGWVRGGNRRIWVRFVGHFFDGILVVMIVEMEGE